MILVLLGIIVAGNLGTILTGIGSWIMRRFQNIKAQYSIAYLGAKSQSSRFETGRMSLQFSGR
jgi:hypothetical protein